MMNKKLGALLALVVLVLASGCEPKPTTGPAPTNVGPAGGNTPSIPPPRGEAPGGTGPQGTPPPPASGGG